MPMLMTVESARREELIDITSSLAGFVADKGWQDGAVHLFCLHTTCGLTINENADPDVKKDLIRFFNEIAPHSHGWAHGEGNTDAHIRSSLLGVSLLIPLNQGKLVLGRWQGVYLYEGDGPRQRQIWLQFLGNGEG